MLVQKQQTDRIDQHQHIKKSKSKEEPTAPYIINNSFYSIMQPKRTSFDIKVFLQLHRKKVRKSLIAKKFEQSLYHFNNINHQKDRKGFKGMSKPQKFMTRCASFRDKRAHTEATTIAQTQKIRPHESRMNKTNIIITKQPQFQEDKIDKARYSTIQASYQKPNLMYNLTLYRKTYKKSEVKKEQMCLAVISHNKDNKTAQQTHKSYPRNSSQNARKNTQP